MAIAHDTRHQVFVSSTYIDLVEERRAVIQALLELDCFPAGMEMFPAANEDQWSLIQEVIRLSDYYVVIVGGRYGSVTPEGISFTEKEYDFAVECGIPVLGFVHADPNSIPVGMSEIDENARERLEEFRKKVKSRMVKDYATADELASVVSRGLIRAMKQHDRPGWVRGDQAMTEATRTQIAELRAALAEAERASLEQVATEGGAEIDDRFEHGDDEVSVSFTVEHGYDGSQTVELKFTWDEIISGLGPAMLDEASEVQLRKLLGDMCWRELLTVPDGDWATVLHPRITVDHDSWGTIVVQLRALKVITNGTKRRTVSDKAVYWRLTPAGDAYLVRLTAIRRDDASSPEKDDTA
ncbi:DUF4062 domain-containing protein [Mumia quercus]|uniref:DUF4062 domain-containing protein n=1 Tax=Mumia quercus TaxID=2976125 RepID=UPI0021D105C0|nr:DUF4062 domain-containing protein [Mumia quercus]